jgi:hypothetical protein
MNTQNFAKHGSFLLFVRKGIEMRLGLNRIICIFKYLIIIVNFAIITENTVVPYNTLNHTFGFEFTTKKMSIQSNLKSFLKAKQTEGREDHGITNESATRPTCCEVKE